MLKGRKPALLLPGRVDVRASKDGRAHGVSDVSANGTVSGDLIREGFWHIVTTKEWR
jgi:hypothetical protein